MLVKLIIFLLVFTFLAKAGTVAALGWSGLNAYQFASGIDGGRGVQIASFAIAFAVLGYIALYVVLLAALICAFRAASSF